MQHLDMNHEDPLKQKMSGGCGIMPQSANKFVMAIRFVKDTGLT